MRELLRRSFVMLRTNGGDHPCIMLTDPFKQEGGGRADIVWVNLSTASKNYDPTCVFQAGEDPLLIEGNYVLYVDARISKAHELDAMIAKRNRKVRRIGHAPYMRILQGMLSSPATPPKVRRALREAIRQGKAG